MTVHTALQQGVRILEDAGIAVPRLTAEVLLGHAMHVERAYFFAHPEQELREVEWLHYGRYLHERLGGKPTQYITGHQEFWGMDFIVSPAVLIPRPETEHLIETVLPVARTLETPKIVDVGTGSGCIALVLAKELPNAEIDAIEISAEALEIARANAARHQLEARVRFLQQDLLEDFAANGFDLVVSNPPYVGKSEEDEVQLEVRKFEPRNAVFAGQTGLEIIERLIPQAMTVLKSGGYLVMEISGTIAGAVEALLGGWDERRMIRDLQSIPRVVSVRKA